MKKLSFATLVAVLIATLAVTAALATFTNGDFEAGTFNGWTQEFFLNYGLTGSPPFDGSSIVRTPGGSTQSVIMGPFPARSQTDAYAPIQYPASGSYTARINGPTTGNISNTVKQTVTVDAGDVSVVDGLVHLRFIYAAVMQDPGHVPAEQPWFYVSVKNDTKGTVLYDKFSYVGDANPWLTGTVTGWKYLDWIQIKIDGGMDVGDQITMEAIAADCSLGGHAGYVYIDEIGFRIPAPSISASGPAQVPTITTPITYDFDYSTVVDQTNVVITIPLPAGTTFASVTEAACSHAAGTVTCNFASLAAGASGTFDLTVNINAGATFPITLSGYTIVADDTNPSSGPAVITNAPYIVTYDANGATSGTAPAPQTKTQDVPLTLATNIGNLARTGYAFSGWNTQADGNGTDYAEGGTYTANASVTLYAKWAEGKIYPSNGMSDVSLSPMLSWYPSHGATSYEYCYSSAPGPCTRWHNVGTNTSVVVGRLTPGYTYHWQVRAIGPGGSTEANGGIWWSFTATTTPFCTWPAYTPPSSPTFLDVPMTVGHWSSVERLLNSTVTSGCGNGNYCPFDDVRRAQMAIFLLRGKYCGSAYIPPSVGDSTGFNDVPLTASYAPWVKQLAVEGITTGCGDGSNYCPFESVNRAQMAIFLLRARHGATYSPPAVGSATGFGDVPTTAFYAPWVKQLAADGITSGCGGGNYCPLQAVNRAQMATFLVRAFGMP